MGMAVLIKEEFNMLPSTIQLKNKSEEVAVVQILEDHR